MAVKRNTNRVYGFYFDDAAFRSLCKALRKKPAALFTHMVDNSTRMESLSK